MQIDAQSGFVISYYTCMKDTTFVHTYGSNYALARHGKQIATLNLKTVCGHKPYTSAL